MKEGMYSFWPLGSAEVGGLRPPVEEDGGGIMCEM